jgi:hypothetical protein
MIAPRYTQSELINQPVYRLWVANSLIATRLVVKFNVAPPLAVAQRDALVTGGRGNRAKKVGW